MEKNRFYIEITRYQWDCGDGCCSDSGFKTHLYDRETKRMISENDDWDHNRNWGNDYERYLEQIEEILGRNPVRYEDYDLSFWGEDHRGNTWDVYESDIEWCK